MYVYIYRMVICLVEVKRECHLHDRIKDDRKIPPTVSNSKIGPPST